MPPLLQVLIVVAIYVLAPAGIIALGIRNGARFGGEPFRRRFKWVVPTFCLVAFPLVVVCVWNWPDSKWPIVVLGSIAFIISLVIAAIGQFSSSPSE